MCWIFLLHQGQGQPLNGTLVSCQGHLIKVHVYCHVGLNPDKGQPTLHSSDLKVTGSIPSTCNMFKYPHARYCSPSAARCVPHGWVQCRIQVSLRKYATFRNNITRTDYNEHLHLFNFCHFSFGKRGKTLE